MSLHHKSIFVLHGIPETAVSDNGPQYAAHEFVRFAERGNCKESLSSVVALFGAAYQKDATS